MSAAQHRVTWTFDNNAGPDAKLTCDGDPTSDCHAWCGGGMNGPCYEDHCECTPEQMIRNDDCRYLTWVEEGRAYTWEYFRDTPRGSVPVRDGLIEFTWDGADYQWAYVA